MVTAIRDGEAIFARAITIASPEERNAYLVEACGDDVALRRQIEERVAAHFQSGSKAHEPAARPAPAQHGPHPQPASPPAGGPARPTSPFARVAAIVILALGAVSIGLAIWAMNQKGAAERARQQAKEAQEQAQKAEEEIKQQHTQAEAARQGLADARDQAVADEKAARDQLADMKAVLTFFQGKVLSSGAAAGWSGGRWAGMDKNVTLRKAVDTAETKVAEAFVDRPLAEATIRETLGATYLDLQEPALAVKQLERALTLREGLQGDNDADTQACRNQLNIAYKRAGRSDEADQLYKQGSPSLVHADALIIRGVLLLSRKKPAEAEKALRDCLEIHKKLQLDGWSTFQAQSLLGEALREQKNYKDAEPLLKSGYEGLKARESKIPSQASVYLTRALARLVHLYDDWNKKDEAAQWRKKWEDAKRMQP